MLEELDVLKKQVFIRKPIDITLSSATNDKLTERQTSAKRQQSNSLQTYTFGMISQNADDFKESKTVADLEVVSEEEEPPENQDKIDLDHYLLEE